MEKSFIPIHLRGQGRQTIVGLPLGPFTSCLHRPLSLQLINPLIVQEPYNQILTQNLCYNYYYPHPKYQTIGYVDPLGYEPGLQVPCLRDPVEAEGL